MVHDAMRPHYVTSSSFDKNLSEFGGDKIETIGDVRKKAVEFAPPSNNKVVIITCYCGASDRRNTKDRTEENDCHATTKECGCLTSFDYWYSSADISAFRRNNTKTAQSFIERTVMEDQEHTIRGLELDVEIIRSSRGRIRRKQLSIRAVLEEQHRQKRSVSGEDYDSSRIAAVYQRNGAKQCQEEAIRMGKKDYETIYQPEDAPLETWSTHDFNERNTKCIENTHDTYEHFSAYYDKSRFLIKSDNHQNTLHCPANLNGEEDDYDGDYDDDKNNDSIYNRNQFNSRNATCRTGALGEASSLVSTHPSTKVANIHLRAPSKSRRSNKESNKKGFSSQEKYLRAPKVKETRRRRTKRRPAK